MRRTIWSALCLLAVISGCADVEEQTADVPRADDSAEEYEGPSDAVVRDAREFVEAMARTSSADWGGARLGTEVTALYRPDLTGPAYYEFSVEPEGFVVIATAGHDWRISHWSTRGLAPSAQLREQAELRGETVEKIYKLDTLSYAAEGRSGSLVAQLGALPYEILIDSDIRDPGGQLIERSSVPLADVDGYPVGGEILTTDLSEPSAVSAAHRQPQVGEADSSTDGHRRSAKTRQFESWTVLKADYAAVFERQLTDLRAKATAGADLADVPAAQASAEQPNDARNSGYDDGFYWWAADGNAAAFKHNQIAANTSLNPTSCASGCGATAWSMLFNWADREAAVGSPKWRNHTGIYRVNGGYGEDVAAPLEYSIGVKRMQMEIRGYIKTFCLTGSGATYPGDMVGAWAYFTGRDHSLVRTTFNEFGFANGGNAQAAVDVIIGEKSPVIIGVGWLSHYPLAHGFAWHPQYGSFFLVNQGWGNGGAEGVPASTWFHGQIVWLP